MTDETPTMEHERRFLVREPSILKGHEGMEITQAYLWAEAGYAIRIRRTQRREPDGTIVDAPYMLTMKGPKASGGSRWEQEVVLNSPEDAQAMIMADTHVVTKHRFGIVSEGNTFEVDEFSGANEGLVIAEFEASATEVANLKKPWWCGEEITDDHRYNNESLAFNPWRDWNGSGS